MTLGIRQRHTSTCNHHRPISDDEQVDGSTHVGRSLFGKRFGRITAHHRRRFGHLSRLGLHVHREAQERRARPAGCHFAERIYQVVK